MSEFQRSPSKVWWMNSVDGNRSSLRSASASPGSQDSGFSDTESSPSGASNQHGSSSQNRKEPSKNTDEKEDSKNLTSNIKEKHTPKKSIDLVMLQNKRLYRTKQIKLAVNGDINIDWISTPVSKNLPTMQTNTEPLKSFGYRGSLKEESCNKKINRNLFENNNEVPSSNQYAANEFRTRVNSNEGVCTDSFNSPDASSQEDIPSSVATLPLYSNDKKQHSSGAYPANLTAPAILYQEEHNSSNYEGITSFSEKFDESDSELEHLFDSKEYLDLPKHTSTPKSSRNVLKMLREVKIENRVTRVPPLVTNGDYPASVREWMKEMLDSYETECMTALQCKSIIGELMDKVNSMASVLTGTVRDLLGYSQMIEEEFVNIKQ